MTTPDPRPQGDPYPPQYYYGGDAQYPYGYPQYGYGPYWQPAPPPPPRRRRRGLLAGGAVLAVAAATVAGVALATGGGGSLTGSGSALLPTQPGNGSTQQPGSNGNGNSTPQNGTTSVGLATAAQSKGIVTINSVLKYQSAESAGTGMILSSNGEILTNNHVVNGATSIVVTVETTGKSYRADVVGTVPTQDVAVLQLRNASGLQTANLGDSGDAKVGDTIVGVGNAGGTGTLRASAGKITALNQTITASDENGSSSERLHGLIGVNAQIISGDSGGPLYDSDGEVIGMNTAASQSQSMPGTGGTTGGSSSTSSTAYAITIDTAESLAKQIESGKETATVHIGLPPFIGVGVTDANGSGAGITSVLEGGPAAQAGITSGSVITGVDGKRVTNGDGLRNALATHQPGDAVTLTWTDSNGSTHTAKVTTTTGPAD